MAIQFIMFLYIFCKYLYLLFECIFVQNEIRFNENDRLCAADSGGVNFCVFFSARGCCNCLLATSRQRHKNAEKFVACCVRAAQLAKLATCFTACNEFMHRRLPPFLTCSTLNRISFNCTFFKCLVNVFFFLFPCFVFF